VLFYTGNATPARQLVFLASLDKMPAMHTNKLRNSIVLIWPLSFVFALCLVVAFSAPAQDKHPFGIDDYSALHSAGAVAISPDGKTILYNISYDGTKGPTKQEWHLIDFSGQNDRKLELPESFQPSNFTKDGAAIWGRYQVDKKSQIGVIPIGGSKPTQIIALPNGIRRSWISPDGTKFAFLADPSPVDPLADVRHVAENDVNGLYVANVNGSEGAWWCPDLKTIGEVAWSADSSQVALATQLEKIGHHDVRSTIWVCSSSGARQIAEIPNSVAGLAWANDGKELAFASTTTDVLTPDHLWTVPVSGGTPKDQTPKLPASIVGVGGDARGTVWVEYHKGTITEAYSYRDGKLSPAYHWPGGVISMPIASPYSSASPALAFNVGDPTHASNVAVANGGEVQKITHAGDDTLGNVALGEVRVVNWNGKDGVELEGILTLPANYEAGKHYPFLVLPHGGPEANDTLNFDVFTRLIAGLGYVVLQPEYRGSTGYGSDFLQAIYQHFGDRAYADVDSASDFAIAQGWADPNRQAIFGWSAGGFMTSWTVTQTHRYKAAIEGAGITDWLSFIPTSDISQVDYDLRLQEKDPNAFLKFSAVMYANQVTTPLLILHGEADQRVPTFQGREYFILLAERGKTVRMVTYPGSPHFPTLAEQRRDVMTELKNWLTQYNP
jgi:dipeptidyl aminopeptidase/acylaminoacyl peptidase